MEGSEVAGGVTSSGGECGQVWLIAVASLSVSPFLSFQSLETGGVGEPTHGCGPGGGMLRKELWERGQGLEESRVRRLIWFLKWPGASPRAVHCSPGAIESA